MTPTQTLSQTRTAPASAPDAPILDVLAERWSTRVFDASAPLDEAALASALEAARWAPSANNSQPWRFVIARRGTAEFETIHDSLMGFNKSWTGAASAFVVTVAETETEDGKPMLYGGYDSGQAAAYFTIQAHAEGLYTHQMGGFDRAAVATAFGLEARFTPQTVMAIGALGDVSAADEALQAREALPRVRRPLAETVLVDA